MRTIVSLAAVAAISLSSVTNTYAQSGPPNALLQAAAAQGQSASSQPVPNANVTITKVKTRPIEIPAGTHVLVNLDRALSSQTDKTDDTFTFTAAQDIVVKGMLVIAKGAPGQGHIINAQKAGMFGKTGILEPGFDWITAVDGEKIHMSGEQVSAGGSNTESALGASVGSSLAGAVIPFAGLSSLAMGGKKAQIGTERPYPIYVSEAVDITSNQAAKIDDGFAHVHSDADSGPAPDSAAGLQKQGAPANEHASGNGPIAITSVAVIPQGSLLTFVCVNFVNNGSSNVTAVRYQLQTFNAFHEKNEDTTVNLSGNYAPGASTHVPHNSVELAPYLTSIALRSPCAELQPESKIVSASVTPIKAGFSDGSVWSGKGATVSGGDAQ